MMDEWGNRLASVLRHRRISQRKLSGELDVTPQAVSKWVSGGEIEHLTLRQMADFLEVNWAWLRYGESALAASVKHLGANDRMAIFMNAFVMDALHSEQHYRATCAALELGSWEINFLTGKNYWSPVTRQLLRIDADVQPSQSELRSRIVPADVAGVDAAIASAMHSTTPFWQRFRMRSNPCRTLSCLGRSVKGVDGKMERIIGLIGDELLLLRYKLPVVADSLQFAAPVKQLEFGT